MSLLRAVFSLSFPAAVCVDEMLACVCRLDLQLRRSASVHTDSVASSTDADDLRFNKPSFDSPASSERHQIKQTDSESKTPHY